MGLYLGLGYFYRTRLGLGFEPAVKEVRCRRKRMKDEREQTHTLLCTYLGGPRRMYRRSPKAPQEAGYLGDPLLSMLLRSKDDRKSSSNNETRSIDVKVLGTSPVYPAYQGTDQKTLGGRACKRRRSAGWIYSEELVLEGSNLHRNLGVSHRSIAKITGGSKTPLLT
jgi:hypothetical protein